MSERVDVQPCKHCGNADAPDTTCSRCGGYGMVTGMMGDPETCPACGCSGIVWPPRCPVCAKFRVAA